MEQKSAVNRKDVPEWLGDVGVGAQADNVGKKRLWLRSKEVALGRGLLDFPSFAAAAPATTTNLPACDGGFVTWPHCFSPCWVSGEFSCLLSGLVFLLLLHLSLNSSLSFEF